MEVFHLYRVRIKKIILILWSIFCKKDIGLWEDNDPNTQKAAKLLFVRTGYIIFTPLKTVSYALRS